MNTALTESIAEDAAFARLREVGYVVSYGPDIAAGELGAERSDPDFRDAVLEDRLRQSPNPKLPPGALEDAYRKRARVPAPSLIERRRYYTEES